MALSGTLTADEDGGVRFTFVVENEGDGAVEVQFSDAQEFDVSVERDGETVWRYGEGRMFAQVLSSRDLAPGETAEYEAEWADPTPGEYEATATLTATDADCTAKTTVSL